MIMKYCYLGVDPAFRQDGFAVCLIEDGAAKFHTIKGGLLGFFEYIYDLGDNVIACVENSNLQDVTFDMEGSKAVVAKKSRNVGANQAASEYTYQAAVMRWGDAKVFQVSPREKGKKYTPEQFAWIVKSEKHKLEGYKKSKQDHRDAYQLALIAVRKARQSWRKTA